MSRAVASLQRRLLGGRNGLGGPLDFEASAGNQRQPSFCISIHVLVIAMIVALVTPAVAFLAVIVQQHDQEHQHQVNETGARIAGEITGRLERVFEESKTVLAVFGSSGWLEAGELEILHSRARRALAGSGRHLILLDEHLDQLLNTRVDFGTPLPKTADVASATKVMETGLPAVSNLFFGKVAQAPVFDVLRPVSLPDGGRGVMILTRNTASLGKLLRSDATSGPWSFAVLDGAGQVVRQEVGSVAADGGIPTGCSEDAGRFLANSLADATRYVFLQAVGGSDWRVCAWAPVEELADTAGLHWAELYPVTLIWIGIAMAVAILVSSAISRSIAKTARLAESLGSGQEVPESPSMIAEITDVRRSLASAAAERRRTEQRLDLLMREMAHRAKNQIALTSSLVQLCARTAASADDLRDDVVGRLLALGRSMDLVTGKGFDDVSLADLIRAQLAPFIDDGEDRLEMRGDGLIISGSAAQLLALVLHEKATNASKHGAWAAQPEGKVALSWHKRDGNLVLDWSETGGSGRAPEHRGFGTGLVDTLVEKALKGTIDRRFGDDGFSCRITLPLDSIEPVP